MPNHILVVDDDFGIRMTVEAILQSEGFDVALAANGMEALERIAADRPALILLDLQMPVKSGWEVLEELRAADVRIPVVFMTAGLRAQQEAERHHADGFLPKPFELEHVLAVAQRFVPPHGGA